MARRILPISGVQSFPELRRDFNVYVDKTMHIYKIATRYKTVFLSRPRRFGKSLLCSTVASLFRAEKELFDGLAICRTDWEWKEHPVIHIDLGSGDVTKVNGVTVLTDNLKLQLGNVCEKYGLSINANEDIALTFTRVIQTLAQNIERPVVIIDEYDHPLLDTIDMPGINAQLRDTLKGFYSVIKQEGEHIRFAFITGITKFSQISLFSGMNQPKDISMMPEYCDICGITQEELETCFEPEIEAYAPRHGGREKYLQRLRDEYNGYYFTRERTSVYNTYGILNHLDESAHFAQYWSASGTPSYLLKYLEMRDIDFIEVENAKMRAVSFAEYKDNTITLFPILYQAGYLTIMDYDEERDLYTLSYPNAEVRQTLAAFLMEKYSDARGNTRDTLNTELMDTLREGDVDRFFELLKWYLESVDYTLSSKITEYYFEFAVSNIVNMLSYNGLVSKNEIRTAHGRMDSEIKAGDYIYILEFKVDKPVKTALRQIAEKDYGAIYARDIEAGKKLIKIGVVFSRENCNIVSWEAAR